MVDTTNTKCRTANPLADLPEAGASETVEITPAMVEAGERAIFASDVWPNLCLSEWSSDLAIAVYRAMEAARLTTRRLAKEVALRSR